MKNRLKAPEITPNAKTLWLVAAFLGVSIGVAEIDRPAETRYPTPKQQIEMDNILRPAAIDAARAALALYAKNPDAGFSEKVSPDLPQPKNAYKLFMVGNKYTMVIDMQKKAGRLDPETVYDLGIYQGQDSDMLIVSRVDYDYDRVEPRFNYADSPDGEEQVIFSGQQTSLQVKTAMQNAKDIAQKLESEVAVFSGENFS